MLRESAIGLGLMIDALLLGAAACADGNLALWRSV